MVHGTMMRNLSTQLCVCVGLIFSLVIKVLTAGLVAAC